MGYINVNLNNDVEDIEKTKNNNIIGIYNKDDNSFVSIKINEGRNIKTSQRKKSYKEEQLNSYIDIYKQLNNYEMYYKVSYTDMLTYTYDLDRQMYRPNDGVTDEQIKSRLEFFEKISEILDNLIKDDKLIEKFMVIINTKGIEKAYIDDESHKGVIEGAVQFLSRQEQIEKIMSTLITFKDPVIVNSKEELEKLRAEFREIHGEKSVHKTEGKEVIRDKKAELLKLMDGQNTRGYIRISHEDYKDVKMLIEEMDIPFIAKESGIKVGMNIIVPTEKMKELKNMFLETNKEILQQVEGNIDWNKIKKIQDIKGYGNVSIESLKDFQNANKDAFKYIAFEKDNKYSVYIEPSCSIIIKGDKIEKKEKNKTNDKKTLKDVNRMKDDYKKSKEVVATTINEKNNNRGER